MTNLEQALALGHGGGDPNMRVRIGDDLPFGGIKAWVFEETGPGGYIVVGPDGTAWSGAPGHAIPDEYAWRIPERMVEPLYRALREHLHDADLIPEALRKDYEHEKARVDKMLDVMLSAVVPPVIAVGGGTCPDCGGARS